MLRGIYPQPHAQHCRRRMEKHLEDDVRVKNAKERLEERKKLQDEGATQCQELKDIEEAAMKEDDLSKLGVLFEQLPPSILGGKEGRA